MVGLGKFIGRIQAQAHDWTTPTSTEEGGSEAGWRETRRPQTENNPRVPAVERWPIVMAFLLEANYFLVVVSGIGDRWLSGRRRENAVGSEESTYDGAKKSGCYASF